MQCDFPQLRINVVPGPISKMTLGPAMMEAADTTDAS